MNNVPFVTWMLGWPIFDAEVDMFHLHSSGTDEWLISAILILVWVFVGTKLYIPPKQKRSKT